MGKQRRRAESARYCESVLLFERTEGGGEGANRDAFETREEVRSEFRADV